MNYFNLLIIVLKLIDDLLDFILYESVMGKLIVVDFKLGFVIVFVLYVV